MIDQNLTSRHLAIIYRTILVVWFIKVLIDPFHRLAELPQAALVTIGPLFWLPLGWLWSPLALWTLKSAILAGLILAFFGRGGRLMGVACALLLTIQQAIIRGLGDINHSDLGLLLVLFIAVTVPLNYWVWNDDTISRSQRKAVVRAMGWVLVMPYCLIACYRLVNGIPLVFEPGNMSTWMVKLSLRPSWFGFELGAMVAQQGEIGARLMSTGFVLVTVLEMLTPFCMVSRKFRWIWLAVMVPFHLSTLPMMNIFFWENVVLVLILFTPFIAWIKRKENTASHHLQKQISGNKEPSSAIGSVTHSNR